MKTVSKILAVDASAAQCAVAVTFDGKTLVRGASGPRQAAQQLLPMTMELLTESGLALKQLDAIAVASGPGSFTGLRIAIGIVQGLSLAANLPVIPISNLALLSFMALENSEQDAALACMEAREQEVYFAAYRRDPKWGVQLVGSEQVGPIAELNRDSLSSVKDQRWIAVGDVFSKPGQMLDYLDLDAEIDSVQNEIAIDALCRLATLHLLAGKKVEPESVQPNYIKEQLDYS